MKGWWCVRFADALAWVDAPSQAAAVRRSLDLYPLGDWTDDARQLVVCPQDSYPENAAPHDCTRADLRAGPPSRRRSSSPGSRRPRTPALSRASRSARCMGIAPVTGASGLFPCVAWSRGAHWRRGPLTARGLSRDASAISASRALTH